jgi:hypothetical protein
MARENKFWWFVFVNNVHARTYGTRDEAVQDMDAHHKDHPKDAVRVDRGTRRTEPVGGGYFIVSASAGN